MAARRSSPTRRDERTIYYALAVVNYLDSAKTESLVEEIVEDFQEDDDSGEVTSLLPDQTLLHEALKLLADKEVIDLEQDKYAPPIVSKAGSLSELASSFGRRDAAVINRYVGAGSRGRDWIEGALRRLLISDFDRETEIGTDVAVEIPASDRFVRVDDNSREYADAIENLEDLVKAVHESRVNDWPEKEGVLQSLQCSIAMLKEEYVNKQAVLAAVYGAVTFIVLKFVEAPIVDLANRTWTAVQALF